MADEIVTQTSDLATAAETERREQQRRIINRLRRASGQLTGVIGMIENEGNCRQVVTQLSAVSKAVDRAACLILATAMRHCLTEDGSADDALDGEGERLTVEDIEKLFLMMT
ncbi:MAG: metal-sensitive transcriptional regulator [Propionibacteriaceae bacterium]|jgi:DNA-binding FrmR family transcriptional regulator|nr:metal-sensitive transcriptional regulator [Propionibacteriaceae bacterium]